MEQRLDLAVIGGGAAGLAAGVMALRRGLRVCVVEKQPRVGKKLLATGNGTCNITNMGVSVQRYHGAPPAFAAPVLDSFSPRDVMAFFSSLGVECRVREDGRVYPLCGQAAAVLDCLRLELAALGGDVERCGWAVTAVRREKSDFSLELKENGTGKREWLTARQVLICTGGAASPGLGGCMDGYRLLEALGHHRKPLFPSIVQVRTDTTYVKAVKGVRIEGSISFWQKDRKLAEEAGEILFTDYGLSGPAVMQISRVVSALEVCGIGLKNVEARLDLLPAVEADALSSLLMKRRQLPGRTLEDYLTGLLHKRLGQTVLRSCGLQPLSMPVSALSKADVERISAAVKGWRLSVTGTRGFPEAQVTAGGMDTAEFRPGTLESRLVPGLYGAGEVMDVDGDCGGFNLHWAWASAHAVVEAAAAQVRKDTERGRRG